MAIRKPNRNRTTRRKHGIGATTPHRVRAHGSDTRWKTVTTTTTTTTT